MRRSPKLIVAALVVLACYGSVTPLYARPQSAAPAPVATARVALTDDEMAAFLQGAKIVKRKGAKGGVTDSVVATLTDGRVTHDAQIQTVDISSALFEAGKATEVNFKDTYKFNIAGYRLARLLDMDNVPMSVERRVDDKIAAMTWWIDDVKMDEKGRLKAKTMGPDPVRTTKQIAVMRVFDELIQNMDRNQGNIQWTSDWKMWLIDHTRAFRTSRQLRKPEQLTRCSRSLLQKMRELTPEAVDGAMGNWLTKLEREALLARRDAIVKLFDDRIAKMGEAAVLFD